MSNEGPRQFSRVQIAEATAAAVLGSAIISTAGGMFWLVVTLPTRLQSLEVQVAQMIRSFGAIDSRFQRVETQLDDHDKRLVRIEVRRP